MAVTDRRVQRTLVLIERAGREVVREKGFRAARVRDIADRAGVSPGTFYAHYADKYALADALVRADFRRTVSERLPPAAQWGRRDVGLLVQVLLQRADGSRGGCRDAAILRPVIQHAAREELAALLTSWLTRSAPDPARRVSLAADLASWTILGAACQWRDAAAPASSAAERAGQVLSVVADGVGGLADGPARSARA